MAAEDLERLLCEKRDRAEERALCLELDDSACDLVAKESCP